MSNLLKLFILLFTCYSVAHCATRSLTEGSLIELSSSINPTFQQIEATLLGVEKNQLALAESFVPEIFGRTSYAETNEKAIISFQPIFTPVKQNQLGVRQNFKYGFQASAAVTTDQRSALSNSLGRLEDITTTTLSFTMQMDLWKDLFGRMSQAKLESLHLEFKKAQFEKDIQSRAFIISLRRLYWGLVANNESLKISEELLTTAKKQATEVQMRFKNAVAGADEVARYEAQVSSRQSTIHYLNYQKEVMYKQLKNLIPSLSSESLDLGGYDLKETLRDVLSCTAQIASMKDIPYQNTYYDEVVGLLRELKNQSKLINNRHSDLDIKLYGTVKDTGVGSEVKGRRVTRGSYGDAIEDRNDNNRKGYEVGLMFSYPFGDTKNQSQKTKELYDEKRLSAAIDSTELQVVNTHQELIKSVGLLNEVIKSQMNTSEQLSRRLKFMQKKYDQARVSVNDLIQDQDALLNSELTTIQSQLQIVNTLFDYFVIYTETPCSFNRI